MTEDDARLTDFFGGQETEEPRDASRESEPGGESRDSAADVGPTDFDAAGDDAADTDAADETTAGPDTAAGESTPVDGDEDEPSVEYTDSGLSTYAWGRYTCSHCGETVVLVWRDDDALVCHDCKTW
ncbi:hypothetical protein OB919_03800 [Halobacteria archaeon AArc-curdl1]|uniref:DUF7573 domain-containing protein n=1 Tax=Natronosalvus hydrolyticus TaxID=2979988 RepID=A0AAP2Z5H7_9EURY|nr:hypothetical protein [Halobacteria archaeon AArc-curdl1]